MSDAGRKADPSQQSDALLWLGGAIIVALGATWLLLSQDWGAGSDDFASPALAASHLSPQPAQRPPVASPPPGSTAFAATPEAAGLAGARATRAAGSVRADLETSVEHNPLRMAELAFDAGMLVEPEAYSAWTLYQRALDLSPSNEAARSGLEKVAGELLKRANVAVEQGRFDDALATIQRIRSALPGHPGANDLARALDSLRAKPAPVVEIRQGRAELTADARRARGELAAEAQARPQPAADGARAGSEPYRPSAANPPPEQRTADTANGPAVDPLTAPYASFGEALARNRLLTPAGESAKHFLDAMISLDANHDLTREALVRFSDELLARADAAIIELDADAAKTWLDEADRLGVNAVPVAAARERLRGRLIEAEAARPVPVSALDLERYVPPTFPTRAVERELEGWVDVEFIVGRDGVARGVTVTDGSHNAFFRREAVEAVEQWRFRPRVFMGEAIEQRAYTRIRFTFGERR